MVFWDGGSDIFEGSPALARAAVTHTAILTSRLVAALRYRRPTVPVLAKVAVFRPERSPTTDHEGPTVSERPFCVFPASLVVCLSHPSVFISRRRAMFSCARPVSAGNKEAVSDAEA